MKDGNIEQKNTGEMFVKTKHMKWVREVVVIIIETSIEREERFA